MDNKLKASQLARCLGVNNGIVSMAVKRKHLNMGKDKKIDLTDYLNKTWIQKQEVEFGRRLDYSKVFMTTLRQPPSKQKTKKATVDIEIQKSDDDTTSLLRKKLEGEIEKRELESKKLKLQIEKISGDLLPTDAVKNIFSYAFKTMQTTYLQEVKSLANIFIQRLGGTHDNFVEIDRELTERVYEISKEAKENLLSGLTGIIEEYQEVRGRGESK